MTPFQNFKVDVRTGPPTAFGASTYGYEIRATGGGSSAQRIVDANVGEGWFNSRAQALASGRARVQTIKSNQRTGRGRSLSGTPRAA